MLSKQEAVAKFKRQLDLIPQIQGKPRHSPDFKKWYRDTQVLIEQAFPRNVEHLQDFTSISYSPSAFVAGTRDSYFEEYFRKGLDEAAAIIKSYIDEVEEYWDDKPQTGRGDTLALVGRMCERFHLIARELRSRHDDRLPLDIEDEYDVQYLMHALLKLEFDDIRPEEWTPSYAGKSSRMDFLLKREQVVIEAKKTRANLGAKELGDQLIIDIARYKAHADCRTLVCFVYDPEGRIANPHGIENDLSGNKNGLSVKVIIAPRWSSTVI